MKDTVNLEKIAASIRSFAKDRDWDQFHSPKNLAASLSIEAAELLEIFQWMTESDSRAVMSDTNKANQVREELADVFYYIVRLADTLNVDLEVEFENKMQKNAEKYPVDLAKGSAKKYTELKR